MKRRRHWRTLEASPADQLGWVIGNKEAGAPAQLDEQAVGDAVRRREEERARGMARLARRLQEQDLLRPDVSVTEAGHVLWVLTSFESSDLLYTGRGLSTETVADLLTATAERALLS